MMDIAQFARAYGKAAGLLLASAAISYFLTFHSTLSPPLKPRQAIYAMSVLVEAYAILTSFNAKITKRPNLNLMIGAILFYLLSLFSLTFLIPTSDSSYREAVGLVCTKQFSDLYGNACYWFWIPPKLLANASFEADRIWEYWSIEIVRFYLSAVWLLLVWAVVTGIALSIRRSTSKSSRGEQSQNRRPKRVKVNADTDETVE